MRPSAVVSNWKSSAHKALGADWTHRPDVGADPGEPLLAASLRHAEALVTPQTPDPLVDHPPARSPGRLGSTPPPPPRAPLGEVPQELPELLFVVGDRWWGEALGGAVLTDHRAGSTFGYPEPVTQHRDGAVRMPPRFGGMPAGADRVDSSDRSNSSWATGEISLFVNPARNTTTITPVADLPVDPHRPTPPHGTGSSARHESTALADVGQPQRRRRQSAAATVAAAGLVDATEASKTCSACRSAVRLQRSTVELVGICVVDQFDVFIERGAASAAFGDQASLSVEFERRGPLP